MRTAPAAFALLLLALVRVLGCQQQAAPAQSAIRVGYFPNITHAQALVGLADGTFQKACGGRVELKPFNAGPAAMEALVGKSIDMAYVGGGPALTAFVRSEGEVQVISGAASGGSVLVVREGITSVQQLEGKLLATPQLGNTQDIALRHFLLENGMKPVVLGQPGAQVLPLANPDALGQFRRGELDGAWVPEPWASRMITEGNGHILVDEAQLWPTGTYPTTVLVATRQAIRERKDLVDCVLRAHRELTARWQADEASFARLANESFGKLTAHPLTEDVLAKAFSRLEPTLDPMAAQLATLARHSKQLGYLPSDRTEGLIRPQP